MIAIGLVMICFSLLAFARASHVPELSDVEALGLVQLRLAAEHEFARLQGDNDARF